jgi:hypothetical protein
MYHTPRTAARRRRPSRRHLTQAKPRNRPPQKRQKVPQPEVFAPSPEQLIDLATKLLGGPLKDVISTPEKERQPVTHLPNVIRNGQTLIHKDHPNRVVSVQFLTKRGRHSDANASLMRGMLPLPPRLLCHTRFQKQVAVNNVANGATNVVFTPTFCYDVDPTVGSTAMPFFTELQTLYRYYRTISSRITVTFANKETFPLTVYIHPLNYSVSANVATATAQSFLANPLCKETQVSAEGGIDHVTLKHKMSTEGFAGSKWTGTDDLYSGNGTTSPSNNWYWVVGAQSLVALVNGLTINVVIDVIFVSFEENSPTS